MTGRTGAAHVVYRGTPTRLWTPFNIASIFRLPVPIWFFRKPFLSLSLCRFLALFSKRCDCRLNPTADWGIQTNYLTSPDDQPEKSKDKRRVTEDQQWINMWSESSSLGHRLPLKPSSLSSMSLIKVVHSQSEWENFEFHQRGPFSMTRSTTFWLHKL